MGVAADSPQMKPEEALEKGLLSLYVILKADERIRASLGMDKPRKVGRPKIKKTTIDEMKGFNTNDNHLD